MRIQKLRSARGAPKRITELELPFPSARIGYLFAYSKNSKRRWDYDDIEIAAARGLVILPKGVSAYLVIDPEEIVKIQDCFQILGTLPSGCLSGVFLDGYIGAGKSLHSEDFRSLFNFPGLRWLNLSDIDLSADILTIISELQYLEELRLIRCNMSTRTLAQLSNLKRLKSLSLNGSDLSGVDLSALRHLDRLKAIDFFGDKINFSAFLRDTCPRDIRSLGAFGAALTDEVGQELFRLNELENLCAVNAPLVEVTPQQLHRLVTLNLSGATVDNRFLFDIAACLMLRELDITNTGISDAGAKAIPSGSALSTIAAGGTAITDDGAGHLLSITNLEDLDLSNCAVSDASLVEARDLHKLRSLNLANTMITDETLIRGVSKLKRLRYLVLSGTNITDKGIKSLRCLKNIHYLALEQINSTSTGLQAVIGGLNNLVLLYASGASLDDDVCATIASLKSLKYLHMDDCNVTDDGIKKLVNLPVVNRLIISAKGITDDSLEYLAKLKSARYFLLAGCNISREGGSWLRSALPDATIDF